MDTAQSRPRSREQPTSEELPSKYVSRGWNDDIKYLQTVINRNEHAI